MPELSPAAEAVLDAYRSSHLSINNLAAALQAAADQAHPKAHIEDIDYVHQSYVDGWKDALAVLQEIADELEAQ
jgi:hypothetical protein